MCEAQRHRGPDDQGVFVDGHAGLAHRRLSIFDCTPAGHQPMSNDDGSLWIVFNGAVYNFPEIKLELEIRGHRFRSQTDTEVIVRAFEEWGPACVDRLNGMFAFAIWNARAHTLFAARDRFGIKPFYFTSTPSTFAFASEIKALFAAGLAPAEPNPEGLADYATLQFCIGAKTMFRTVRKLEPGCTLTVDAGGDVEVRRYWSLDFTIDEPETEDWCRERLTALLNDAVRLQLRADVPLGAHLSGGLDSSLVVSLAAKHHTGELRTYSGGFREGGEFDETSFARAVSESAGTTHSDVFPDEDAFIELLPRMVRHLDEPVAGPGVFPQWAVSQLAARDVRVVLGGQGGDELFGGYTRYLVAYLEACIRGAIDGTHERGRFVVTFESIVPNLAQLRGYEPLLRHFWSQGLFEPPDRRYFRLIDRGAVARSCLTKETVEGPGDYSVWDSFAEQFHSGDCGSLINRMTHFDLQTLLPSLLQVEDRVSMAASIESRVPLLDHRIAEMAAAMPPSIKYSGGRSKHILREAAAGLVPPVVLERKDKMGFPVPLRKWAARSPFRDFTRDLLLGTRARQRGVYDTRVLQRHLDEGTLPERDLWGLMCLELWMQTFIDVTEPAAAID
jgi:asparagine synthase (glutamine-hydrolysing)